MRGINTARVVVGGLVAGLVINVSEFILNMVVMGADMNAAMTRLNLPPVGGQAITVFVVLGFALGIGTIWLYAAIRPRYGAGLKRRSVPVPPSGSSHISIAASGCW